MTEKEVMTEELEIATGDNEYMEMGFPAAQEVEKRVIHYLAHLKSMLKMVKPQDWNYFSRKTTDGRQWKLYRLSQFAAKRIRIPLGISLTNVNDRKIPMEDEKGQFYLWIFSGIAGWRGLEIYVEGTASIRDKFFSYEHGAWKPLSEVNQKYIRKAALNNLYHNAVVDTFGFGDFTADDLRQLGFDPEKVARGHEFPGPEEKGKETKKPPTGGTTYANDAQVTAIRLKAKKLGWDAETLSKFVAANFPGKKSTSALTSEEAESCLELFRQYEPPSEGGE